MKTIAELQADFCAAFEFNGPTADQMKPTGEIDGHFIWVYKLRVESSWAFKAAVPVDAKGAAAVSAYLAGLDAVAPDHSGGGPDYDNIEREAA